MWVYFSEVGSNSSLTVRKTITHGTPARIGQVGVFSFFLHCPDIVQDLGYSCTVDLINPLGESNQILALTPRTKTFALLDGETNQNVYPFVNNKKYFGYEYYFDNETILNMYGTWKASVKYYTRNQVMVTGEFSFYVENSDINVEDDITISYSMFQSVEQQIASKQDLNSPLVVKAYNFGENLANNGIITYDENLPFINFSVETYFINKGNNCLYKVISNEYNEEHAYYEMEYSFICKLDIDINNLLENKLDKQEYDGEDVDYQVYAIDENNNQKLVDVSYAQYGNAIPLRDNNSNIIVGLTPVENSHATSKKYVDDLTKNKVDKAKNNLSAILYGNLLGAEQTIKYSPTNEGNTILYRDGYGRTKVSYPNDDLDATNKKYVDDKINKVINVANGKTKAYVCGLINGENGTKGLQSSNTDLTMQQVGTANIIIDGNTASFTTSDRYLGLAYDEQNQTNSGGYFEGQCVDLETLNIGDVIYIVNLDVPDFWYGGKNTVNEYCFYKLETAKVNLTILSNTKILHELIYDGTNIKDEEGNVLTFVDIKTLLDSPSDYVYINDLTNHCMLNFGAYEDDALWFNSRYKIFGSNHLVRLIINDSNQINYDDDELLVQHIINVSTNTAVGSWKYQLQFDAPKSITFTMLYNVANYLYNKKHNIRMPISGTYTENGSVYIITSLEAISTSQVRIEMYKVSDGTYKTIDTGSIDVIDTII